MNKSLKYYFWATYHRKKLDELQEKHKRVYKGIVLDIGGRDRGKFIKPKNNVKKWIFADIEKKHNPDLVLDVAVDLNLDYLQFHGDETPEACLRAGRPFLRAARIPLDENPAEGSAAFDLVKYAEDFKAAQAILLDAHVDGFGGGGKTFNWSLLPPSVNAHLVLSGGLTPANVTDGILQVRPRCKTLAVDVSSGVEISATGGATLKGIKSADKIHQFVAAVRAADDLLAENHVHLPAT